MENIHDESISSLREKIKKLISLYEEKKIKCSNLEQKNKELNKKINTLDNKITEAEQKVTQIRLSKTMELTNDDTHDAKIMVNRIVREIDNCIALLNR